MKMRRRIQWILPILLMSAFASAAEETPEAGTEVLIVSSLHSAHRDHASFDYDDLYQLISDFGPDFVGVEIRPEDIGRSRDYLSRSYPREMIELALRYEDRTFGVDWLGQRIEGAPIPESYFSSLPAITLSAGLENDEDMMANKPERIAGLEQQQSEIVASATAASLADGRYGALCREIDELEQQWLAGSEYEAILAFHRQRDEEIGRNLVRFIEDHPGSRIAVVLGADHRTYAVEAVQKYFGDSVTIAEIPGTANDDSAP